VYEQYDYTYSETKSTAGSREDSFNFYHSSLRMHIEQAFGVFVARSGILWKPLCFDLHRSARVVDVAIKLHNYGIGEKEQCSTTSMTGEER